MGFSIEMPHILPGFNGIWLYRRKVDDHRVPDIDPEAPTEKIILSTRKFNGKPLLGFTLSDIDANGQLNRFYDGNLLFYNDLIEGFYLSANDIGKDKVRCRLVSWMPVTFENQTKRDVFTIN